MEKKLSKWTCGQCGTKIDVVSHESLKAQRLRHNLTLRALSEKLECSFGYLNDIEHGRRKPIEWVVRGYESLDRMENEDKNNPK